MPLFWPAQLQLLLPLQAHTLLIKQQQKLQRDWSTVSSSFPQLTLEEYTHTWLLVSTRTFYYTPPNLPAEETPIADECLAIVPFGDYFNHTSEPNKGCKANYSPTGYEFILESMVEQGEELFISYGSHGNDFLLVEYGFLLPENLSDSVALDHVILPLFTPEQNKILEGADYLGNYVLNNQSGGADDVVCYRTTTALRLLCMPFRKWKGGLTKGFDDADSYQGQVIAMVRDALKTYRELAEQRLKQVSELDGSFGYQTDVLMMRWGQILVQLTAATDRIDA